jgi:phosphatidylinositol alpha-1,6-mannosyltransferase
MAIDTLDLDRVAAVRSARGATGMPALLLTEVFPPTNGGSGRWFWEIYRRLPRTDVVVAAGRHPRQEEFDRTHDLRLHRLRWIMPTWGLLHWRAVWMQMSRYVRMRRVARGEGIQAVHIGKCLPEGIIALALKWLQGLPFLCYVHGEELNMAESSRELRVLTRAVLRNAGVVVANSQNTARILREEWKVPEGCIRILHPGVDTTRFVPAPRSREVRARLGWGERPVILTVGRLQKRKGQDHLILALKQIRRAVPDVLYAIVGDGEERDHLRALVAQEGLQDHVQFRGEPVDAELVQCYQQCDLFALPNRQVNKDIEGFGMVLLEAQSCGKPVIAGASGGTAETMRIPETGRVVCCDGPDLLADLVIDWLGKPAMRSAMGEAARAWAVARFDWEALTREARAVFRELPRSFS